jgi:exonuclease SbcD
MRILHTADWHLGDRLGRIDRTQDLRRAVERVASYAEQENVDVLLVAGDLFSELSRAEGLRESIEHLQQVFVPFLHRGGTVIALTGNHDNENFCQTLRSAMTLAAPARPEVGVLLTAGRFYLAAEPMLVRFADLGGSLVQFVLLPYPTPSRYLDHDAQRYRSAAEKNQALAEACRRRLRALEAQPEFDKHLPAVLAAHVHVQGAQLSNLFRINERDSLLLQPGDFGAEYAYVALGHIHQPQCLGRRVHVRYSGSIERLDLGESQDNKSVTLVELGPQGLLSEPVCLPLPATPIYDLEICQPRLELPRLLERVPDAERALVRYRLTYRAGEDNLEEILTELDRLLPRWYDRQWREASARDPSEGPARPLSVRSFQDTVHDYLQQQLADHADQQALLQLADTFLGEEA